MDMDMDLEYDEPQSRQSNLHGNTTGTNDFDDFEFNCPQFTDFSREEDWDNENENADGFFAVRVSSLGGHDGVKLPHYMRMSNTHRFSISGEKNQRIGSTSNLQPKPLQGNPTHSAMLDSFPLKSDKPSSTLVNDGVLPLGSPVEVGTTPLDSSSDDSTLYNLAERSPTSAASPCEPHERPALHQTTIRFTEDENENKKVSMKSANVKGYDEERAMVDVTNSTKIGALQALGTQDAAQIVKPTGNNTSIIEHHDSYKTSDLLPSVQESVEENLSRTPTTPTLATEDDMLKVNTPPAVELYEESGISPVRSQEEEDNDVDVEEFSTPQVLKLKEQVGLSTLPLPDQQLHSETGHPFMENLNAEFELESNNSEVQELHTSEARVPSTPSELELKKPNVEEEPHASEMRVPSTPPVVELELNKPNVEEEPHASEMRMPLTPPAVELKSSKPDVEEEPHASVMRMPLTPPAVELESSKPDVEERFTNETRVPSTPPVVEFGLSKPVVEERFTSETRVPSTPPMVEFGLSKPDVEEHFTSEIRVPSTPPVVELQSNKPDVEEHFTSETRVPSTPPVAPELDAEESDSAMNQDKTNIPSTTTDALGSELSFESASFVAQAPPSTNAIVQLEPSTPPIGQATNPQTPAPATPFQAAFTPVVPPTLIKTGSESAQSNSVAGSTPANDKPQRVVVATPPSPSGQLGLDIAASQESGSAGLTNAVRKLSLQTDTSHGSAPNAVSAPLPNLRRATPRGPARKRADSSGSQISSRSSGPSYLNATKSSRAHERKSLGSSNPPARPSSTRSSSSSTRRGFRTEPKTPALLTRTRMNAKREVVMSTTSLEIARVAERRKALLKERMKGVEKVRRLQTSGSQNVQKQKPVRAVAPKLSSSSRPGAARAEKLKRDKVEANKLKARRASGPARFGKTEPAPFSFASDKRQELKERLNQMQNKRASTGEVREEYEPLAAKVDSFYRTSIRKEEPVRMSFDLTSPKTPRFATDNRARTTRRRSIVKSTAELEEEYVRSHNHFTARTLNRKVMQSSGDLGVPKVASKPTCQPKAFSFRTDKRAAARPSLASTSLVSGNASKSSAGSVRSTGSRRSVSSRMSAGGALQPTVPEPFKLSTESRAKSQYAQQVQTRLASELEAKRKAETEVKTFKARPVPNFSKPQRVAPVERKQLTVPEPFNLRSVQKHEQYETVRRMEIQRQEEEEAKRRQFKALQVPQYPATPQPKRSNQELTQPVSPTCLRRAEEAKELQEMKLRAIKEKEAEEKVFHAKPVPVTTHRAGFQAKHIPQETTKPVEITLQSDIRAQERKKFEIEQQRHMEEAEQRKREDDWARKLQEDRELRAQRQAMQVKARDVPEWVMHPKPLKRVQQQDLTDPESPFLLTKLRSQQKVAP